MKILIDTDARTLTVEREGEPTETIELGAAEDMGLVRVTRTITLDVDVEPKKQD